jgi:hypothetical protein
MKSIIDNEALVIQFRELETDFICKSKLPFVLTLLFMLNLLKKYLVIEIDNFIKTIF